MHFLPAAQLSLACSKVGVRQDHPGQHEVEEKHGVRGQSFSSRRLTVAQELHGGVGGPDEADQADQGPDDEERVGGGGRKQDQATDGQRHGQWEQAVAWKKMVNTVGFL